MIELRVPGVLEYRDLVTRAVARICNTVSDQQLGSEPGRRERFSNEMVSAVGEAFNNVVIHAYAERPGGEVTLLMRSHADHVEVQIRDTGAGFDPASVASYPEDTIDPASLPEGGMGLYIMREFVDEIDYVAGTSPEPNILTLRKYFS